MVIYAHMKSLLPIVFIVLALTAAITYSLAKKAAPREINRFGISANQLENILAPKLKTDTDTVVTPTPPKYIITPVATVTATPTTPLDLPEVTEPAEKTKGGEAIASADKKITKTTKTTKTTVCTPVYGMANTCTEHVVVDTGAADSILFNLAGLSYIGGLISFVKAKSKK